MSNIVFSNYDDEPQSIFKILKTCIQGDTENIKLKAGDTFDKVTTDVKINYMAKANDNLFTVF